MIPREIRLAAVDVAAINATLMGIWAGVTAVYLFRIIESMRASVRHAQIAFMTLRKIEAIPFGLGLQLPAEYFYSSQDQFRELAHQLAELLCDRTEGEPPELGARALQLISALFNQYPFVTRAYKKNGGTAWHSDPEELFKDYDRKKIDKWIDDISWLGDLLVPAVALASNQIAWLLEQFDHAMSALWSAPHWTSHIHQSGAADAENVSSKAPFAQIPRLFAVALREARGAADEARRLLGESDNAKRRSRNGRL